MTAQGATADTGTGGVTRVPTAGHQRPGQDEAATVDMNYFLGIDARRADVLVADFEDNATGLNHPVAGSTPIPADGTWHHAAATYDGTTWRLYLDGELERDASAVGPFTPRSDSIQHAAIGSRAELDRAARGLLRRRHRRSAHLGSRAVAGRDSGRHQPARSRTRRTSSRRWGLNERRRHDGRRLDRQARCNGTITGSGWTRTAGAPFNLVFNQRARACRC